MNKFTKHLVLTLSLLSLVSCSDKQFSEDTSTDLDSSSQNIESTLEGLIAESEGQPDRGLENIFEIPNYDTDLNAMNAKNSILAKYNYLDPQRVIRTSALAAAVQYFETNKKRIANQNYITLIDFSKSSSQIRQYIVNMKTGAVWSMHVSHGTGSDRNNDGYADKFSNVSGSNTSSLGFYLTAETYYGKNGYSLRLDGLSSTNSRARSRAVVIHGADYVKDYNRKQGRSWGCPAVSRANNSSVINSIKGGSLIYAYN